jgi:hypothetical protein
VPNWSRHPTGKPSDRPCESEQCNLLYLKAAGGNLGPEDASKTRIDCQLCPISATLPKLDVYTGISIIDLRLNQKDTPDRRWTLFSVEPTRQLLHHPSGRGMKFIPGVLFQFTRLR